MTKEKGKLRFAKEMLRINLWKFAISMMENFIARASGDVGNMTENGYDR